MALSDKRIINGKPLVCGHCGNEEFAMRQAQLNTTLATFFNLDAIECFQCGGNIPAGQTQCLNCGWTYTN